MLNFWIQIAAGWLLVTLTKVAFDYWRGFSVYRGVPQLVALPFFRHLHLVGANYHRLLDFLLDTTKKLLLDPSVPARFRKLKTFCLALPFKSRLFITYSPVNVEHALKTNFKAYEKGPELYACLVDLLGNGIFNADGHNWFVQRKIASHIFNVANFKNYYVDAFRTHALKMVDLLAASQSKARPVDLFQIFNLYTLESFALIGFGEHLGLLDSSDALLSHAQGRPETFAECFDTAQNIIDKRIFNPFWKITEHFDGSRKIMTHSLALIRSFSKKVISARRQRSETEAMTGNDLLELFMNYKPSSYGNAGEDEEEHKPFNDDELHDVVMNMIIAGRDTTAQALSWTMYRLLTAPNGKAIIAKIRQEISEKLPDFDPVSNPVPTYDQVKEMTYCKSVLMETLRLHPSVPKKMKQCVVESDVLPDDGVELRKGDFFTWCPYIMGRLPEIWGADCLEFKPERFVNDQTPSHFKFTAFHAGPRLCLGMNMAYLEATMALVMILHRFDLKLAVDPGEVTYGNALTLPLRHGLPVYIIQKTE